METIFRFFYILVMNFCQSSGWLNIMVDITEQTHVPQQTFTEVQFNLFWYLALDSRQKSLLDVI